MLLKVINCQNYKDGCAIGLFGGNPSAGVCAICDQRQAKDSDKPAVETIELPTRVAPAPNKVARKPCGGCSRNKEKK